MSKWLFGGVAALAGVAGAWFFLGAGRPGGDPAAVPGALPGANAQPADPAKKDKDTSRHSVEEVMPARKAKVKSVSLFDDAKQTDSEITLRAGRVISADRPVYFVRFDSGLAAVDATEADARAFVRFLKLPTAGLPADAVKGGRPIASRRWEIRDAFGQQRYMNATYYTEAEVFRGHFGTDFLYAFTPGDFAPDVEKALADIDTLKAIPASL